MSSVSSATSDSASYSSSSSSEEMIVRIKKASKNVSIEEDWWDAFPKAIARNSMRYTDSSDSCCTIL